MSERLRRLLDEARRLSYKAECDPAFSWRDAFRALIDELRQAEHEAKLDEYAQEVSR